MGGIHGCNRHCAIFPAHMLPVLPSKTQRGAGTSSARVPCGCCGLIPQPLWALGSSLERARWRPRMHMLALLPAPYYSLPHGCVPLVAAPVKHLTLPLALSCGRFSTVSALPSLLGYDGIMPAGGRWMACGKHSIGRPRRDGRRRRRGRAFTILYMLPCSSAKLGWRGGCERTFWFYPLCLVGSDL